MTRGEGGHAEPFRLTVHIGTGESDCLDPEELPEVLEEKLQSLGHDPDTALVRGYDAAESGVFLTASDDIFAMPMEEWKELRDQQRRFGGNADMLTPYEYAMGDNNLAEEPTIGVFDRDHFTLAAPEQNDFYYRTVDEGPVIAGMLGSFLLNHTDEPRSLGPD